ncbi:aminotransferase class V-fold PLP-dependent enzyme [Hyphomicrobium sp. 802]|uniref:aminotransferase class V-fold PLP-dependent enzyme n=1 Tax=Hyphomicrobium sp. 802 TaxID=1112272 RepID=UPI00045E8D77|nr:aminotransferase class V-fold PLP-dependent enzyme [Hyphomicrobium sp. 802]
MRHTAGIPNSTDDFFSSFKKDLARPDRLNFLASELIGRDAEILGPFGAKPLIYADYVASGRALALVERFVIDKILPFYANSHTEASFCGGLMTRFRRAARAAIAECCNADSRYAVIFAGSGATAGLNRLVSLFGIREHVTHGVVPRVIIGPYEHHSNILPWRESGAEIVEIAEAATGGPDWDQLHAALIVADDRPVLCAFSAASNVTGIVSDVAGITRMAKAKNAKIVWDYAGAGPYLPINMQPANDAAIDAVVISPHKFIGGPAASGILIVRKDGVVTEKPTWPGGGTVKFVTPTAQDYSDSLEVREESGTPNVVGDIRAALAFLVKEAIGIDTMTKRNADLRARALAAWGVSERIELLGHRQAESLPIFSFRIRDGKGGYIHQQLITRMLSDRFGIQARGGCACAGPYVHRLLRIDEDESADLRRAIAEGDEIRKPGFVRLNFSVLLSDDKADYILNSVTQLAQDATAYAQHYDVDPRRAIFHPKSELSQSDHALSKTI